MPLSSKDRSSRPGSAHCYAGGLAQYTTLDVLGLDEIALKKGHRDFVVIVTARLATGHQAIPSPLRTTIHTLCTDMYENYIHAAHAALPSVQIVSDRFHVARKYRDAADTMRRAR